MPILSISKKSDCKDEISLNNLSQFSVYFVRVGTNLWSSDRAPLFGKFVRC